MNRQSWHRRRPTRRQQSAERIVEVVEEPHRHATNLFGVTRGENAFLDALFDDLPKQGRDLIRHVSSATSLADDRVLVGKPYPQHREQKLLLFRAEANQWLRRTA